jgi:hypothetical protein
LRWFRRDRIIFDAIQGSPGRPIGDQHQGSRAFLGADPAIVGEDAVHGRTAPDGHIAQFSRTPDTKACVS